MLRRLLEASFLPPAAVLLLLAVGALVARRWRRTGRTMQGFAVLWLWLLSTPFVSNGLLRSLQSHAPLAATGELPAADAIVVLSAEADPGGSEYGGPTVGPMTLQRLRYGAALHRRTHLPVLVSGGLAGTGLPSLAAMMAATATNDFGVAVRWQEDRSADTRENARFSAEVLHAAGVRRVLLVTSAWHMPRAVAAFERSGLTVIPAPTGFVAPVRDTLAGLTPSWHALRDAGLALHEWIGRLVYAVRG